MIWINSIFRFVDNLTDFNYQLKLQSIFERWLHEAAIDYGLGNLQKLVLQLFVLEDIIDVENSTSLKERGYEDTRTLSFSINYTMNGR